MRALGREHRENGLLARLLLSWPPARPKRWSEAEIDPQAIGEVDRLVQRLVALEMPTSEKGDLQPVVLELSASAKERWIRFYDDHAEQQEGLSGELRAHWSKLEGCAALPPSCCML